MKCFSPIKSPKLKRFSLVSQNPGNKAGDSVISSMEKSANSLGNSRREEGGGRREERGGRREERGERREERGERREERRGRIKPTV